MDSLEILRAVDFDWTLHVRSVWTDNRFSASQLHRPLRRDILEELEQLDTRSSGFSPLGRIVLGPAGAGKTHLLGELRREAAALGAGFVLVDMTDVNDFMETVALGYLSSLFQPFYREVSQCRALFRHLLGFIRVGARGIPMTTEQIMEHLHRFSKDQLMQLRQMIHSRLRRKFPEAIHHQDVIRAFLLLNSPLFHEQDTGYLWLQGHRIPPSDQSLHSFTHAQASPREIIQGLSWLMHLKSPVLMALDQFDAIVSEVATQCSGIPHDPPDPTQRKALAIIEKIAGGLMALRDITSDTLTVAACLETTWAFLQKQALKSSMDRFRSPDLLGRISKAQIAATIVGARLTDAFDRMQFSPPYPTWPIRPQAFETATELFPREILKRCEAFRLRCLKQGTIEELASFDPVPSPPPAGSAAALTMALDTTYRELCRKAPLEEIMDPAKGDDLLGPLIHAACRCLIKEANIPDTVDATLETQFSGGAAYRTLHARITLIHRSQAERERHFCIRGLQKENSRAFQSRLKAAMTASGISRDIAFRHLLILRTPPPPTGAKTDALLEAFKAAHGRLGHLSETDIRTMWALMEMEKTEPDHFEAWLARKRPITHTGHFQLFFQWLAQKDVEKQPSDHDTAPGPGNTTDDPAPPVL